MHALECRKRCGVISTNNEDIAEKCRKYADLGYRTLTAKPISNEDIKDKIQQPDYKRHELVGYNFRIAEVCAAMGLAQLNKIDYLIKNRIQIANLYMQAIEGCNWLIPQKTPEYIVNSYWTFAMKLDEEKANISWNQFRNLYLKND